MVYGGKPSTGCYLCRKRKIKVRFLREREREREGISDRGACIFPCEPFWMIVYAFISYQCYLLFCQYILNRVSSAMKPAPVVETVLSIDNHVRATGQMRSSATKPGKSSG